MIGVVVQRTHGGVALIDVVRWCLAMFDDRWRKVRFAKQAKNPVFSVAQVLTDWLTV
jgi:hypothetical protein